MDPNGGRGGPPPIPPIPPIDPSIRPRGLPILVPQYSVAMDMPSNLPKFYGTRDDNPSRHMERYVERMVFSLVTDRGYWLVWFPTTLEGEAYEWYRDHAEEHFRNWEHLQGEFLNEFRPEVGQSTTLSIVIDYARERGGDLHIH